MKDPEKPDKIEIDLEDLEEGTQTKKNKLTVDNLADEKSEEKDDKLVIDSTDLPPAEKERMNLSLEDAQKDKSYYQANLVSCPRCGNQRAQEARYCPTCGILSEDIMKKGARQKAQKRRSRVPAVLVATLILLVLGGGLAAAFLSDIFTGGQQVAAGDKTSIAFSTAEGVEYSSPAGLQIEVLQTAEDLDAELKLDAAVYTEPEEEGILEIYSTYDIKIITEKEMTEHPQVSLSFAMPPGLDGNNALVLWQGPEGISLPGGEVEVTEQEIKLLVPELSTFIVAMPYNISNTIPLIREPDEASLTDEGHIQYKIKLEAVEPLFWGFGSSPWYAVEALSGRNQISVEAPDDLLFNQLTPGKSYLGPQDQKDVIYTFYGIGGEGNLIMSASAWDAIVITWIDALYRIATGDPLPWPVSPDLLRENEEVAMLMDLFEHLQASPQDLGQQHRFSLMGGADTLARYFWEETRSWASGQGREFVAELVGTTWWCFIRTVDLFVGQVIYALAGETEHYHHFYVRSSPKLSIEPEQPEINAGDSILLGALLKTHAGETLSYPKIAWKAEDGGSIDADGRFWSFEDAEGEHKVTASLVVVGSGGNPEILEESISVTIKEAKDKQRAETEPRKTAPPREGQRDVEPHFCSYIGCPLCNPQNNFLHPD